MDFMDRTRKDARVTAKTCVIRCSPTRIRVLWRLLDRLMTLPDVMEELGTGERRSIEAGHGKLEAALTAVAERNVTFSHHQIRALARVITIGARVTPLGQGFNNGEHNSMIGAAKVLDYAMSMLPACAVVYGKSDPSSKLAGSRKALPCSR